MNNFKFIVDKISRCIPLSVVFVNDTGFIGGAGIAHRRQIQSFLLSGHNVSAICWMDNTYCNPLPPRGSFSPGKWLGLHSFPNIHRDFGLSDVDIAVQIQKEVESFKPDLVIFGNLHWAKWPIEIIETVSQSGTPTIAYLHDCHWLTGRCAYTGGCNKYLEGCDHSCPSPEEYPPASSDLIAAQWKDRRRVFCGLHRVPFFANSHWMQSMAEKAFNGQAIVRLAPLGLDEKLFSPIDRALARRLLSLPNDSLLILAGAVNLKESRKSGPVFERTLSHINSEKCARVITFGSRSNEFPHVISLGHINDERIMPVIYSAADILIHTAQEESFGQTLMEAAACGIPSVAFSSGGIVDIARHGMNAVTIEPRKSADYYRAVRSLIENQKYRIKLGQGGRHIVEQEFTLIQQYRSWCSNIEFLANGS